MKKCCFTEKLEICLYFHYISAFRRKPDYKALLFSITILNILIVSCFPFIWPSSFQSLQQKSLKCKLKHLLCWWHAKLKSGTKSHKGKKKSFSLLISFKLKSYDAGKHSLAYADHTWCNHYHVIFACGYDYDPRLELFVNLNNFIPVSFPNAIILKVSYNP